MKIKGVLQYVVIKILTTTLTVICVNNNIYGEGELFNFFRGYPYIVFIDNWSQLWALYCLAMFYSGLKEGTCVVVLCCSVVVFSQKIILNLSTSVVLFLKNKK